MFRFVDFKRTSRLNPILKPSLRPLQMYPAKAWSGCLANDRPTRPLAMEWLPLIGAGTGVPAWVCTRPGTTYNRPAQEQVTLIKSLKVAYGRHTNRWNLSPGWSQAVPATRL